MSDVPSDVLIGVFLRLSAKTLASVRYVCKSWYKIISEPSFTKAHLLKTIQFKNTHHHLLITCPNFVGTKIQRRRFESPNEDFEFLKPPFPMSALNFVGTCDGILCIGEYYPNYRFLLWNPVTRQSNFIQFSPKRFPVVTAFGFDSENDDYKIMHMTPFGRSYAESVYEIEVYSKKSDCWRKKNSIAGDSWSPLDRDNKVALHNGSVVHWLVKHHSTGIVKIMYFDMVNEVLGEINFSNTMMMPPSCIYLAKLDGCLAVFVRRVRIVQGYQVWVMRKYGVVESWTLRCGIAGITHYQKPLGINNDGKVLLAKRRQNKICIVSYDPDSKISTEFGIDMKSKTCRVDYYTESLISTVPRK